MFGDIQSVFDLPFATLVVLAAGFAAYRVAFTGKKKGHGTIDIVFITVVFAALAKFAFEFVIDRLTPTAPDEVTALAALAASTAAFATVLIAAGVWRRWGEDVFNATLRAGDISYSDGHVSAWDCVRVSTSARPTQLVVRKTSGKQLMCDNLEAWEKFPFGPSIYGEDGSIALYVTGVRQDATVDWLEIEPLDDSAGASMTYIPADQISEIEVRYLVR
ncbi:hypothetical protein BN1012_Phect2605 [Candidatus Phaeomarinobacter ectocarpi]|uniref:Uncharacterized protein n=1 Tax=Candidatus Phaeomarinibacter ectocarpi TaxID=1458461 RepID=X5MAG0_9HYPH|nr:hypothetical protein [Candidatus Phaeomarinobacter ectocarpi]CDO60818.1 hypothetical protein BN1012_Phect2605 [Candidatus Phaeomarinobacter ectocarpi]